MAKTNAEIKNAYAKRNYDDIRLQVRKGMKERIKEHAQKRGFKSLQGYINNLIEKDMEQHSTQAETMQAKTEQADADQISTEQADPKPTGTATTATKPTDIDEINLTFLDLSFETFIELKNNGVHYVKDFYRKQKQLQGKLKPETVKEFEKRIAELKQE